MDQLISGYATPVAISLFVSIGIFGAFKAGQLVERSTGFQDLQNLKLEQLKLKTESKLELLCLQYRDETAQLPGPDETQIKEFLEKAFLIDESVVERIIGLTQIYFDLQNNGTGSSYFVLFLNAYGNFLSGM